MNNPYIMHLRSMNPNYGKIKGQDKFRKDTRGITVYGIVEESDQGYVITFSWTIQSPRDQYNKKYGIELAKERYNTDSAVTVQCDYYPTFPMKYQFFNAVALAREQIKTHPESFSKEDENYIDLTFGTLCQIAFDNKWFYNVESVGIPKIHPDIMINFVSRLQNENCSKASNLKRRYLDPLIVSFADKVGYYAV